MRHLGSVIGGLDQDQALIFGLKKFRKLIRFFASILRAAALAARQKKVTCKTFFWDSIPTFRGNVEIELPQND